MIATATLHRGGSAARTAAGPGPMVLIDGVPRNDLWVRSMTVTGPLDLRSAELVLKRDESAVDRFEHDRIERLLGKTVTILQPVALTGGETRLIPLLHGKIGGFDQRLTHQSDELTAVAHCDWQRMLDANIERAAMSDLETIGAVIERVSRLANLDLSLAVLPAFLRVRRVAASAIGGAAGDVLQKVFDEAGLIVRREPRWSGHGVTEERSIVPSGAGRPIHMGVAEFANPAGVLEQVRRATLAARPVKLVARAGGAVVESTFDLVGGWDPGDESFGDSEFGKSTSSDFDRVANVFRLWVLNEDGSYSGEPFNRGTAFSLTALFEEGRGIERQPLRFNPSLTRDAAGRSAGVIVEFSIDGGGTWSRYAGIARVLSDRAGVYLDDDALSPAFISAGKAGLARVRVTASMTSPLPLEKIRWSGNPFAGPFVTTLYTLGERFRYRRIGPLSRFAAQVAAGLKTADVADDRAGMETWLAEQATVARAKAGEVQLQATGVLSALRIGDRLEKLAGAGLINGAPERQSDRLVLIRTRYEWDRNRTVLTFEVG